MALVPTTFFDHFADRKIGAEYDIASQFSPSSDCFVDTRLILSGNYSRDGDTVFGDGNRFSIGYQV
ncbi:MAG TPA: hypothetical protein VKU87_08405 [Thermomicrobiaceae bacterium]|nr:hypothetical protein [Thermomicrobiaceae bacterium]